MLNSNRLVFCSFSVGAVMSCAGLTAGQLGLSCTICPSGCKLVEVISLQSDFWTYTKNFLRVITLFYILYTYYYFYFLLLCLDIILYIYSTLLLMGNYLDIFRETRKTNIKYYVEVFYLIYIYYIFYSFINILFLFCFIYSYLFCSFTFIYNEMQELYYLWMLFCLYVLFLYILHCDDSLSILITISIMKLWRGSSCY